MYTEVVTSKKGMFLS